MKTRHMAHFMTPLDIAVSIMENNLSILCLNKTFYNMYLV